VGVERPDLLGCHAGPPAGLAVEASPLERARAPPVQDRHLDAVCIQLVPEGAPRDDAVVAVEVVLPDVGRLVDVAVDVDHRVAARGRHAGLFPSAASRAAQMSSWRLLPACWMKIVWSTPAASNSRIASRTWSGVPMPPLPPGMGSWLPRKASHTLVRPGTCAPRR